MLKVLLTVILLFISSPLYAQNSLEDYELPDMFGVDTQQQEQSTVFKPVPPEPPKKRFKSYNTVIDNGDVMSVRRPTKPKKALLLPPEKPNYEPPQQIDLRNMSAREILETIQGNTNQ